MLDRPPVPPGTRTRRVGRKPLFMTASFRTPSYTPAFSALTSSYKCESLGADTLPLATRLAGAAPRGSKPSSAGVGAAGAGAALRAGTGAGAGSSWSASLPKRAVTCADPPPGSWRTLRLGRKTSPELVYTTLSLAGSAGCWGCEDCCRGAEGAAATGAQVEGPASSDTVSLPIVAYLRDSNGDETMSVTRLHQ